VAAMANTGGGWILFGVKDRKTGQSPRDRVVGIPLGQDLAHQLGQKLVGIVPAVHFQSSPTAIPVPGSAELGIFIARIPVSALRPHIVTETGVFYRRTDGGGAEPMSFYEVRDQMLLTEEHTRRLTLLRLELLDLRERGTRITNAIPRSYESFTRFDTRTFKSLLADVLVLLPPNDLAILRDVLSISAAADEVNVQLDDARNHMLTGRMQEQGRITLTDQNVQGAIRTLIYAVDRVEEKLAKLFGPLTTG